MAECFGRYWLHEKIGHGGMAEIFRATIGPDPETYAFDLALKRLHAHLENDQSQVDMFLTEADVAKFLRHPNLVRVYEAGLCSGRAYIAMEYIWGHDLARLISLLAGRGLRFPSDLAVYTALQILRALDYVHRARSPGGVSMELVHRDVTPANVYVTLFGEVKLGDFGVARISFLESHDESGLLKGKAAYMPPEILAGEPVDQRVDLWGVAVILYEMLTGRKVYEGVTEDDLMAGAQPPPIVRVEKVNPDVDPRLARIANRALSPAARKRPADALSFYQQLKLYLRDTGVAVDTQAMSRFVAETTGSAPSQQQSSVDDSSFRLPDYAVPIGTSPTQRFEQRERTRARVRPLVVFGALLLFGAVVFGIYRLGFSSAPAPAVAPAPDPGPAATATATDIESAEPSDDDSVDVDFSDVDATNIVDEETDLSHISDPATRLRALIHRGRVQLRRGRPESALEAFQAAAELKPEHDPAQLGQANALLALERFDDAEGRVNVVLERKPKHGNAFLILGHIMAARGDSAQARWAYERCLKVAPPEGNVARSAKKALSELSP